MLDTNKLTLASFIAELFVVKLCYLCLSISDRFESITRDFGALTNVIEAHSLVDRREIVMQSDIVEYVDHLFVLPNDQSPQRSIAHAKVVVQVFYCLFTLAVDRLFGTDLLYHSTEVPILFEQSIPRKEGVDVISRFIPMFELQHVDMTAIWIAY